jgi:D-lactate dehydrogenase
VTNDPTITSTMKIAFFSTKSYDREYFDSSPARLLHEITYFDVVLNHMTASLAAGYDGVCAFVNDFVDRETITVLASHNIGVIALRSAGFNNVDLKAASEFGIRVVRVPAYSPQSVAEHSLALIMTLNRKTHRAFNRVRESNFSLEHLTGFNLYQKTVGVIGTGLIGSSFCKIMLGMGCRVLAFDLTENEQLKEKGVIYKTQEAIWKESDIISLHCPLNASTAYMLNAKTFEQMKEGVMIINTSRGGLINTSDAIEALKSGRIGYLGIDVYEQEEGVFFHDRSDVVMQDDVLARLISFSNVLITGHMGFFTKEALSEIANITLQNLTEYENKLPLTNEVLLH